MPRLSTFYGIAIYMYYSEPHLQPHFQAVHAGKEITVRVADMNLLAGGVGAISTRLHGNGYRSGDGYTKRSCLTVGRLGAGEGSSPR